MLSWAEAQLHAPREDLRFGSRPLASPPCPQHPVHRYPRGSSWHRVTCTRTPVRGTPSAWQPPMARPLSLWHPGAPAFPGCPPLRVSGFPSTQTQSPAALTAVWPLTSHLTPLGVSCLILLRGPLRAGNESADRGRLWTCVAHGRPSGSGSGCCVITWQGVRVCRSGCSQGCDGVGETTRDGEALWLATVASVITRVQEACW